MIELLQTFRKSAGKNKWSLINRQIPIYVENFAVIPMIVRIVLTVEYPKSLFSGSSKFLQAVMVLKLTMSAVIRKVGRRLQRMKMQTMASKVYTRC